MSVIVIGAGLSGLAAAYRLQNAAHEVEVIEAADRPGGRCKAVHRDGFIIDTCPEWVATIHRTLQWNRYEERQPSYHEQARWRGS